ncbi:MAG: aldehyde dehydrogenase family protein [Calditrichaeota bacterium]|nr:MAG: aldehyde dehydrogenase family protein [Calditrichota bacterium]
MAGLNDSNLQIAKTIKLYINGAFPRTESGRSFPLHKFNSKKIYANLCRASRKDLRNAVAAAKSAQSGWCNRSAYNRAQILYRMAEMTEGKRNEFVETFVQTLGYSPERANLEVDRAIDALVYYAGFADKYQQLIGAVNPVSGPHHNFTTPEPVGVVGLLCREEFDFSHMIAQIAAITCPGNSLVILLAEEGAAVLAPLAEVFATSDLPDGVINLLSGFTSELYEHMAGHMELDSICFDGKNEKIRARIKEEAIHNLKRAIVKPQPDFTLEHILAFVEYKTVWHPIGF